MKRKLLSATALALALCLAVLPVAYADSNSCDTAKPMLANYLEGKCDVTDKADILNKLNSLTGKNLDLEGLCQKLPSVKTKDASSLKDLISKFMGKAPKAAPVKANDKPEAKVQPAPQPTKAPTTTKAPAPTKVPAPTTKPAPTKPQPTKAPEANNNSASVSQLEKDMVAMVNEERAKEGKPALKIDAGLTKYARMHSQDMADNNFFSHTSPTKGSFSERIKNSGISYRSAGENIARYGSVAKAHVGLMNSEGHRKNIMGNFTHVGIGIVWDNDKNAYSITQWFATLN